MALSRIFPQSRIMYVTHSQKGKLAERVLGVESVDSEIGWHPLYSAGSDLPKLTDRPAKLLEGAHTAITFTAGRADPLAEGILRCCSHVKVISLDTRKESPGHVTQSLLEQLHESIVLSSAMEQMLRSIASRGVGFHPKPQDCIVIHPGAGKEHTRWPAEHYLQLIKMFRDTGKTVRVLLGETEIEQWPADLVSRFESAATVHRPSTLLELLDEIAAAKVYIGNDSGPTHLAGIIGVPTLAIFGSNDPTRWRPLGPRVSVLTGDSMAAIDPQSAYTDAVTLTGG